MKDTPIVQRAEKCDMKTLQKRFIKLTKVEARSRGSGKCPRVGIRIPSLHARDRNQSGELPSVTNDSGARSLSQVCPVSLPFIF